MSSMYFSTVAQLDKTGRWFAILKVEGKWMKPKGFATKEEAEKYLKKQAVPFAKKVLKKDLR